MQSDAVTRVDRPWVNTFGPVDWFRVSISVDVGLKGTQYALRHGGGGHQSWP